MKIIKKIPVRWKSIVDNIEEPNFIYYGQQQDVYDYKLKRYKVYTNADYFYGTGKGLYQLKESNYSYVIRMKFKFDSTTYKGFFLITEKDDRKYLQKRLDGIREDHFALPKMSALDFFKFFEAFFQKTKIVFASESEAIQFLISVILKA